MDDILDPILLSSDKVRTFTQRLVELYPWDIITIAISPIYCGGYEKAKALLEDVLNVMDIDINKIPRW